METEHFFEGIKPCDKHSWYLNLHGNHGYTCKKCGARKVKDKCDCHIFYPGLGHPPDCPSITDPIQFEKFNYAEPMDYPALRDKYVEALREIERLRFSEKKLLIDLDLVKKEFRELDFEFREKWNRMIAGL